MSISPREWKELTESSYFKLEEGTQANVVMKSWHRELRSWQSRDGTKEEEKRPTFVALVTNINGEPQDPPKEFTSSNKALNTMIMEAVLLSESQGRDYIKVRLFRIDKRTYNVVDLANVDMKVHGAVLPPRPGAPQY